MRTNCVNWPGDDRLVMVRQSAVDMCDGNHCAAALLNFFAYWHGIKVEQAGKAVIENQVAVAHGDEPTQNTKLWQFHTTEDLSAGLLGLYGKGSILAGLSLLVQLGVVETGRNPNPRYAFDNTKHFLFHPEVVNDWMTRYMAAGRDLLEMAARPAENGVSSSKNGRPSSENGRPSSKNGQPSSKNGGTIPEITTKITTETPIIDHHHHGDDDDEQTGAEFGDPLIGEIVSRRTDAVSVKAAVPAPTPPVPVAPPPMHGTVSSTETRVKLPEIDPQVAALSKLLMDVGVGVNSYTWEKYQELAAEFGMPAVIAGVQAAADNGKQQSFKYVQACIVSAAKGNNNATDKRTGTTADKAAHASGGGSGAGAGETAGRKPRKDTDPDMLRWFA
jgi:hypothetical protein